MYVPSVLQILLCQNMLAERAHGIWIFLLSIFVIYVINLYKVQVVLYLA